MRKEPKQGIPWWSSASDPANVVVRERSGVRVKRAALAVLLILPVALAAFTNPGNATRSVGGGGERQPASLEMLAQGCTGITSWPGSSADGFVDQPIEDFSWPATPPSTGNFAMTPWSGDRASFVVSSDSPNVPQVLASLYRGAVVIWYNPVNTDAVPLLLNEARELTAENPRLIVAPWPLDEDSSNPWRSPRPIAFVSWGKTLGCLTFDRGVLDAFIDESDKRVAPDVAAGDAGPQAALVTRPTP